MRALGIIPAKGDSTGVENKNMRKVAGEPLIDYAIRVADMALSEFIVVTDDIRIVERVADNPRVRHNGMPHTLRSGRLDDTPVADTSRSALSASERYRGYKFDAVVLLQPDSPIRTPLDIDNCLKMLQDNPDADGVISVYKVEDTHPAHMYAMAGGSGRLFTFTEWEPDEVGPRQTLSSVYHRNGAIYVVRRDTLMNEGWIPKKKLGYVMPRELSLTIDTEFDLMMAERQVQLWKEGKLTKTASAGFTSIPSPGIGSIPDRLYG